MGRDDSVAGVQPEYGGPFDILLQADSQNLNDSYCLPSTKLLLFSCGIRDHCLLDLCAHPKPPFSIGPEMDISAQNAGAVRDGTNMYVSQFFRAHLPKLFKQIQRQKSLGNWMH